LKSRRAGLAQFLLVVLLLGAGAVAVAMLDTREPISGAAYVNDGDTITIDRQRIRIVGIDAPELDQPCTDARGAQWRCGRSAREHLVDLVASRPISCVSEGRDKYGRILGRCRAGDTDLGADMVEAGLAVSYGDYKVRETLARVNARGIWAGSFEVPQQWRRTRGEDEGPFDLWGWLLALWRS